jgi:murein DD-endopeptidase MepM/ murein hydrolase activator NlpD
MAEKYTVKKGDTLSAIAKANKTTVSAIVKANPAITNPNVIKTGQKITLPGTASTGKSTGTSTGTSTVTNTAGTNVTPPPTISTTVPSVGDTLSMEQLEATFSIAAGVINNNPDLLAALNRILGKTGGPMITDPALQKQIIQATGWYRNQTDTQRQFDYFKTTNPGQFAANLQLNASDIVKKFSGLGLNITASQAIEYAENMMKQAIIKDGKVIRFDQDYLKKIMAGAIDFTKTSTIGGRVVYTKLAGQLETAAQNLYKTAWDYGFPQTVSNERFSTWFENALKGTVAGTLNPEDLDNELQARAKSFAPGLANLIDQGQTLREAADPWLNAIADVWEVDYKTLDLNDDYVQRAINFTDEKGNIAPMSIYDAKKMARRSNKWDNTSTAKEEKTRIASTILKDFGFLG